MDKNKSLIKSLLTGKLTKSQRKEFADLECVDREIRTQWKESGKRNVNNQIKQQIWNSIKVKCKHTKSYQVLVELIP